MFLLKKIIAPLFFPIPVCLLILLAGLALLWFTRRQKAGKVVVSVGALLLLLFSHPAVSGRLLMPLERQYPPLEPGPPAAAVKWVVVLGGGHTSDPRIPLSGRLSSATLSRLVEAIRLRRSLPGAKLILSGGAPFGPGTDAGSMQKVAEALGLSPEDYVLEAATRDTEEQAQVIKGLVGADEFILVTSASHMPRAMALFVKAGMKPIAAPADYQATEDEGLSPAYFYPSTEALGESERAIYEYLGRAWAALRGKT